MMRVMFVGAAALGVVAAPAAASFQGGVASTDRFGYAGQLTRHASLADAQAGTNPVDTISVTERDLALTVAQDDTTVSDANYVLGSWWYTQDTFFSPTQGRAGWGNTTGNTGVGYLQMFDQDASTDTLVDMAFSDFDGTYYRQFDLTLEGAAAGAAEFSRLSAIDNLNDGGIWHSYRVDMTATGLEGQMTSPGVIESNNQPTGVSGSITGIYEITENDTSAAAIGFYAVDLSLNMDNWAWDNRASLTPEVSANGGQSFFDGSFSPSLFRTVPSPGAAGVLALAGLVGVRRRR